MNNIIACAEAVVERDGVCVIWGSRKAAFLLYDILLNL